MKQLSCGSIADRHALQPRWSRRALCLFGAAAGVLISTIFTSGTVNGARAEDTVYAHQEIQAAHGKHEKVFHVRGVPAAYAVWEGDTVKADTVLDSTRLSGDTLTAYRTITCKAVWTYDWTNDLAKRLVKWCEPLDMQGREKTLRENLEVGTEKEAVMRAARQLGLSDTAMQRLRAFVSTANGRRH
jgi:hypothetical protein